MAELSYPSDGEIVLESFVAYGQVCHDVHFVSARVVSFSPTIVHYATEVALFGQKSWRASFQNLVIGRIYDLEILDQDGRLVASANNLEVTGPAHGVVIQNPTAGQEVCSDFVASGSTTADISTPLLCMKIEDSTGNTIATGTELARAGSSWSASFSNVTTGTGYKLKIGHSQNCSDGDEVSISVKSC